MKEWKISGGRALGFCTPDEHLTQKANHILSTLPKAHLCYNSEYGFDKDELIGNPLLINILQAKATRLLKQALTPDGFEIVTVKLLAKGTTVVAHVIAKVDSSNYGVEVEL